MTSRREIRNWLFKQVAAEQTLDELEGDGVAVRAAVDPGAVQRVLALEDFSAPIRRAAMTALPAYLAFFCLENAIRELIVDRLLENHGTDWWDKVVPSPIRNRVEKRQEKEGKNRWHMRRGDHKVNYTDFGDLKSIIQSNWGDFDDLFPYQDWITGRLEELEASRNIIAHSNTLEGRELERIRIYLEDWVKQVG